MRSLEEIKSSNAAAEVAHKEKVDAAAKAMYEAGRIFAPHWEKLTEGERSEYRKLAGVAIRTYNEG